VLGHARGAHREQVVVRVVHTIGPLVI